MRFSLPAIIALISFSFLEVAFAEVHAVAPSFKRRHVSSRVEAPRGLEKRFDNTRFTLYKTGLGACGKTNSDSDFIVALNQAQYANGAHCFETITIQYNGKSQQAQIVDECPSCPFGGLDFSPSLFAFFASESLGQIYGSWTFGSGDPPKSTTTQPKPEPTTTHKPSTTSTSHSSTSTTTSSPSSTSSTSSSTSTTDAPTPTPTDAAVPTDVIAQFYMIMVNLGGLAVVAGSA